MEKDSKIRLFYIFPFLYVISVYLLPVFLYLSEEYPVASDLMILPPVVFGVINIIVSAKFCRPENRIMLFNSSVLVKYALIPFFVIGGIMLAAAFLISFIPVPFMIFVGPVITIIGTIIGWLVLAFGSPYVIAYLCLSVREHVCTKGIAILHAILQFFFALDVIDIMCLTFKERRWKKLTIFLIILLIAAILLLCLLLVLGIIGILTQVN